MQAALLDGGILWMGIFSCIGFDLAEKRKFWIRWVIFLSPRCFRCKKDVILYSFNGKVWNSILPVKNQLTSIDGGAVLQVRETSWPRKSVKKMPERQLVHRMEEFGMKENLLHKANKFSSAYAFDFVAASVFLWGWLQRGGRLRRLTVLLHFIQCQEERSADTGLELTQPTPTPSASMSASWKSATHCTQILKMVRSLILRDFLVFFSGKFALKSSRFEQASSSLTITS